MSRVKVNYWAEGPTDRAAARKLINAVGAEPGDDYSIRRGASPGKDFLDKRLKAFNAGAQWRPWLVLRDSDGVCAVKLVAQLLEQPAPLMRLRVVVPTVEAWLLADRERFAGFIGVPKRLMPDAPELLPNAKSALIGMVKRSASRSIREAMLPLPNSGRREGPEYATRLIEFINVTWSPSRAAEGAPSLGRALRSLKAVVR